MKWRYGLGTVLLVALLLSACATDDPNRRAKTGAVIGGITGGVLGHQMDGDKGRFVGAAAGAITGAAVGHYMDRQERAFEKALAEEQRQHQLEIERLEDESLKISIPSEVSFDFDSAAIKPAFHAPLNDIARVMREYDRTVIHVIGHTDSVGAAAYNQGLSERRAASVADYLAGQAITRDRIRTEGRGETEPRAANATEAGRQLNRRVELVVKPVVEGDEQRAYESPAPRS